MWLCEKETGDLGDVSQPGDQSKVYAEVRAGLLRSHWLLFVWIITFKIQHIYIQSELF